MDCNDFALVVVTPPPTHTHVHAHAYTAFLLPEFFQHTYQLVGFDIEESLGFEIFHFSWSN